MSLHLADLDACTRRYMLEEFDADLAAGTLYRSPQLSEQGADRYQSLLRAALTDGSDVSFAEALGKCGAVLPPGRWQNSKDVAAEDATLAATVLLAEREFHRFYIRGLCRRALDAAVETLVIYRAKPSDPGRSSSDAMVGVQITVRSLLEDLRGSFRSLPPHGLPQCRDPGLSVRLPDTVLT
ncbi:MAG: hypothetical protein AB7P40_25300 [Chloroflexota bacterium]